MLWRAAVAWMSLVLAAGPGGCCCCAVAAVLTPPPADSSHAAVCPCCVKVAPAAGETVGREHCHCSDPDDAKSVLTPPDPSAAEAVARSLALPADLPPPAAAIPARPAVGPPDPPGRESVARRLLDRHHRLRC